MRRISQTHPAFSSVYIAKFDDRDIFWAIWFGDAFETMLSPPVSLLIIPPPNWRDISCILALEYKNGHLQALAKDRS
jgi:hypothetical protein